MKNIQIFPGHVKKHYHTGIHIWAGTLGIEKIPYGSYKLSLYIYTHVLRLKQYDTLSLAYTLINSSFPGANHLTHIRMYCY
jgi:hypothetical protein